MASQAQIIDDLLDLSRINTGKLALNWQTVDWLGSIESIVGAIRSEAAAKGVTLSVKAEDEGLVVQGDPVRIEQIVWNLLNNALKFTSAGGAVTLRAQREGKFARLDVDDTGRGIDADTLPHVFEMYKQAEPASARVQGGLGIGLAVVSQLVSLHGGRVAAASPGRDRGATFSVWLPLAAVDEARGPAADPMSHPRLHGRRVLVVDDDPAGVDTLRHLLETEGMQVLQARSAAQALEQAAKEPFDVVLTDIAMPQLDGKFIKALRRAAGSSDVPVIAVTGLGRPADVKRALDAGFRMHLTKPLTLDRLLTALDEVLRAPAPAK